MSTFPPPLAAHRLNDTAVVVSQYLPSLDVAIERFGTPQAFEHRDVHRFAQWIPAARLDAVGLWLNEAVTPEQWDADLKPWTAETFAAQLTADVTFGMKKARNQRGISAKCMYNVVEGWLRVLAIRSRFPVFYQDYGIDLFREVAQFFVIEVGS